MHPGDKSYRNMVVRITDLTVNEDIIRDVTFENCQLIGPAILAPLGATSIMHCGFDGDADALIWSIPSDRTAVIGAIGAEDCTFSGCRFTRIGLAVPAGQVAGVRAGLGV